jgi:hypothetical protein
VVLSISRPFAAFGVFPVLPLFGAGFPDIGFVSSMEIC